MPIDVDTFRLAMRRLAAGVCLITTETLEGARTGMTATAVCSVSAHPPTLLCCVNRKNSSYQAIAHARAFAVNVLALDDRTLADHFAQPISSVEKYARGLWGQLETGAPILESALASFDCRLSNAVEVGTHGILFGEIHATQVRAVQSKPLLYAHGGYGGFAAMAAAGDSDSLWIPSWDEQDY